MAKSGISEVVANGDKPVFCEVWHTAVNALRVLYVAVSNPFVRLALTIVIKAGNKVYKKMCVKPLLKHW